MSPKSSIQLQSFNSTGFQEWLLFQVFQRLNIVIIVQIQADCRFWAILQPCGMNYNKESRDLPCFLLLRYSVILTFLKKALQKGNPYAFLKY
jgi:hypothetical protein